MRLPHFFRKHDHSDASNAKVGAGSEPPADSHLETNLERDPDRLPEGVGELVLKLARRMNQHQWLSRRADQMLLEHERTVRHKVDVFVDIRGIDPRDLPRHANHPDVLLLPIYRLPRANHILATASVQGLGELNRPTMQEERSLVCAGLADKWTPIVSDTVLEMLLTVVAEQPREKWIDTPDSNVPPLPNEQMVRLMRPFVRERQRKLGDRVLEEDTETRRIAVDLLLDASRWFHQYLMIVELPEACLRHGTTIISIEYLEPLLRKAVHYYRKPQSSEEPKESWGDRVYRWWKNIALLSKNLVAGSYSVPLRIPVRTNIGTAMSTHISLEAPEGVRVIDAVVMVDYGILTPRKRVSYPNDGLVPELAHVYVGHRSTRVHHAEFRASLYAYKSGFAIQAAIASLLLVALVAVTWWRVAEFHYNFQSAGSFAQDATALLLLVVPAVIAAITQIDSHRATSRCLYVPRVLLSLSVISVLGTAGLVAFGANGTAATAGWPTALIITAAIAFRLNASFVTQWIRTSRRHAFSVREKGLEQMDEEIKELDKFEQETPQKTRGALV